MASNRSPGFRGTKLERCSRLCGSREEDFLRFSHMRICKTDKPRGRAIFGPGVIIFRNMREDQPWNIPVQYCRNWPSSFRGEDFLRFSYEKTDKPSGGAILGPGS